MKKLLIPVVLVCLFACNDDDESTSKLQLLTNGSSKSWVLSSAAADNDCGEPQEDRMKDNSWIFFADGKFMFDGGEVTEAGECSDMINVTGTWKFLENETVLDVYAAFATEEPEYDVDMSMFTGKIKTLTETTLVIEVDGEEGVFTAK